jgi:alpha-L-fucosidase 2
MMKTTRRQFLQTSALTTLAVTQSLGTATGNAGKSGALDAFQIARSHSLTKDLPTPNFFEGMLLGNGDVGVCVVVRPDALGLHIGKNDCWDIRLSDEAQDQVLPFPRLLELWQRAGDEAKRQGKPDMLFLEDNISFFHEYTRKVEAAYLRTWPRPWPCGTFWLHWDPRWVQTGKHTLDPSNGSFSLNLKCVDPTGHSRNATLTGFVDWMTGLVSASTDMPVPLLSLSYYPKVDEAPRPAADSGAKPSMSTLPNPELDVQTKPAFAEFSCFQYFPAVGPTEKIPSPPKSDKDRNFSLHARIAGRWTMEPREHESNVSLTGTEEQLLRLDIKLATPRDILLEQMEQGAASSGQRKPIIIPQDHAYSQQELDTRSHARREIERLGAMPIAEIRQDSDTHWREFWSHSAVQLEDKELEAIWYHNQYFLACCLRAGKTAPGLFGNWSKDDLGTAWHGDYHMDYNCEQVFWGVFSSNHVDQHLPYLELCQNLLAMSERFAHEKFELPGACFPLTAVPVPSQSIFIPSPPWAYLISNTPWTVQSLWWQYLYTQDLEYLQRAYPILRSAARFLAAYVKLGSDGKYHVIPTVSPENWGFTVDFRLNKDCIIDLALIQFLFDAVIEGSALLDTDAVERTKWKNIRENLASYPKGKGPYGEVWLDVVDAPHEHVYNVPVTLAPVFPGEQVGIGCGAEYWEVARRTASVVRLEGGNDLVFQPLIRARLGMLDLEWFKREVRYCSLPNGVANDRIRQVVGRYDDSSDFDGMMRIGFWTENFSLPVVINECMMQSYSGSIRLFPNTQSLGPSRFENLRAAGAFLVSASFDGARVTDLSLLSEKGKTARMVKPWSGKGVKVTRMPGNRSVEVSHEKDEFIFHTLPGAQYRIEPA